MLMILATQSEGHRVHQFLHLDFRQHSALLTMSGDGSVVGVSVVGSLIQHRPSDSTSATNAGGRCSGGSAAVEQQLSTVERPV